MGVGLLELVVLAAAAAAAIGTPEAPGARYSGLDSEISGTVAPRLRSGAPKVGRLIRPPLPHNHERGYATATTMGEELVSAGWSVLFGLVLICVAPCVMYSNEAAHVKRGSMFSLAERATKTVDPSRPAPADDGQLVAFSGPVEGGDTLVDTLVSAVAVADALLLQRKVEILQWVEKSSSKSTDNLGGGHSTKTTYRAELEWCAAPKPEGQLKHLPEYVHVSLVLYYSPRAPRPPRMCRYYYPVPLRPSLLVLVVLLPTVPGTPTPQATSPSSRPRPTGC